MMRRAMMMAGVIGLALAACGGSGGAAPTTAEATTTLATATTAATTTAVEPTTTAATTTEPPTTTTAALLTKEQAAARYLDLVGPMNAAVAESNAYFDDRDYRNACKAVMDPADALASALAAETRWPTDVAPLVAQYVPALQNEAAALRACAGAPSNSAGERIWWGDMLKAQDQRTVMGRAIRALLGLPVPTD